MPPGGRDFQINVLATDPKESQKIIYANCLKNNDVLNLSNEIRTAMLDSEI